MGILSKGINFIPSKARSLGTSLSHRFFRSTLKQSTTWLHFKGNFRCGRRDCPCCPHILGGQDVTSSSNGKIINFRHFFYCNTTYVVYVITCKLCNIQYVGQTTHRLQDCFYEHLSDIRLGKSTNVARHFNNHHDGDASLVHVQVVERVKLSSRGGELFRLVCKRKVFTHIPSGLNNE